jgi:hypothetical protein
MFAKISGHKLITSWLKSIYLAGEHIEGQTFNLKCSNLNKTLSKLQMTHFVLF